MVGGFDRTCRRIYPPSILGDEAFLVADLFSSFYLPPNSRFLVRSFLDLYMPYVEFLRPRQWTTEPLRTQANVSPAPPWTTILAQSFTTAAQILILRYSLNTVFCR